MEGISSVKKDAEVTDRHVLGLDGVSEERYEEADVLLLVETEA